tara:strand:- start:1183 stop:2154 length:972 start_codon:yes stop_codon:yes gene_type:complete
LVKKKGNEDKLQPIIVKKVKKGGGGHHGGAWKVAYADFVTAMMAFFLLLWLLNVTTDVQKEGIADYFDPTALKVSQSESGAGGVLGGLTVSSEGAMTDTAQVPLTDTTPQSRIRGQNLEGASDEAVQAEQRRREEASFAKIKAEIEEAISENPELEDLGENLQVDVTPEGLRIQIIDQAGDPMFPSGSARMFTKTENLMAEVSQIISKMPNDISIRGHTDATPYRGSGDYTNWELSADRANASRRVLLDNGYTEEKIANVVGKADTDHFNKEDPTADENRRISIILLRATAEVSEGDVNTNDNARTKKSSVPYQRSRGNIRFP